jgi:hypothetical protein
VLVLAGAACSPTFDWRETRPDGALTLLFPCKVDRYSRTVVIEGLSLPMSLASCQADGQTFALSYLDAPASDRIAPLLQALQRGLRDNVAGAAASRQAAAPVAPAMPSGAEPTPLPFDVKGATPHPLALRVSASGMRPDGEPMRVEAGFFRRDLRIYQVTVIGRRLDAPALETFLDSLVLTP